MRIDIHVPNEATGLTLHPADLAGAARAAVAADLATAATQGRIVALSLGSDRGLTCRVIVDEPLAPDESDARVGRASGWLDVRDGTLVLEGGFDPRHDDHEPGRHSVEVPVPSGRYRVDVLAMLSSPNGPACLAAAGVTRCPVAWFHEACPGCAVPAWLVEVLEDLIDDDAEFEEDEDDDGEDLVDFVVHLTSLDAPPDGAALSRDWIAQDWIAQNGGARVPPGGPRALRRSA